MKTSTDDEYTPKMSPWRCTHPKDCGDGQACVNCGVTQRFPQFISCEALTKCEIVVPAKQWLKATRRGKDKKGKEHTQVELTDVELKVSEIVSKLSTQLDVCREHVAESNWLNRIRRIDIDTIPEGTALSFTDFSATLDLRAALAENSSVDNHAVLAIFVMLSNRRLVGPLNVSKKSQENNQPSHVNINTCDVWFFFGPSMSKGKKNDHVFHNACFEHITAWYQKNRKVQVAKQWTDNCACQYKCKHTFLETAKFSTKHKCAPLSHSYAQVSQFKGCWDAAGKVAKDKIRQLELTRKRNGGTRVATAYDAFAKLQQPLENEFKVDWGKVERELDPMLHSKGKFGVDNRMVGFVTDDHEEFQRVRSSHPNDEHILYTDRTSKIKLAPVEGTHNFHKVEGLSRQEAGGDEQGWNLITAQMPCSCLGCRGKSEEDCPYQEIRREGASVVKLVAEQTEEQRDRRNVNQGELQQLEAQVKTILGDGVAFTNKSIKNLLKAKKEKVSGNKLELCKRLIEAYKDAPQASPNIPQASSNANEDSSDLAQEESATVVTLQSLGNVNPEQDIDSEDESDDEEDE
jgi:hypothetical protein